MRTARAVLLASVIGCLVACHFQGRKFFLFHLLKGSRSSAAAVSHIDGTYNSPLGLFLHPVPFSADPKNHRFPRAESRPSTVFLITPLIVSFLLWPIDKKKRDPPQRLAVPLLRSPPSFA